MALPSSIARALVENPALVESRLESAFVVQSSFRALLTVLTELPERAVLRRAAYLRNFYV